MSCGELWALPVLSAPPPLDVDLELKGPVYRAVAAGATGTGRFTDGVEFDPDRPRTLSPPP